MGLYISAFIQFFSVLNAFATRTTHAGRVCSGDYLAPGANTNGYLIEEGSFLKWSAVSFASAIVALSILALGLTLGKLTYYRRS